MSRSRKPSTDPHRKAHFREEARGIVARDRHVRNYGGVIDTAGAIAGALERAYKRGFAEAQDDPVDTATDPSTDPPLDWALIPPRPRHAFWSCCMAMFGEHGRLGHLEPGDTERSTMAWRLITEGGERRRVFRDSSIQPLIKLGLLEPDASVSTNLTASARGRATWDHFLALGGRFPDDLTSFRASFLA